MSLKLPPDYFWEFTLAGDPLSSLLTQPAPENCAIGVSSNGVLHSVFDGHSGLQSNSAGLLLRRAQQQLIALFGVADPRVHGIYCELEDRPTMLLVVESPSGRSTVMPTGLAMDFLKRVNAGPVVAQPAKV